MGRELTIWSRISASHGGPGSTSRSSSGRGAGSAPPNHSATPEDSSTALGDGCHRDRGHPGTLLLRRSGAGGGPDFGAASFHSGAAGGSADVDAAAARAGGVCRHDALAGGDIRGFL